MSGSFFTPRPRPEDKSLSANFTRAQKIVGVAIALFCCLICFMLGVITGRFQAQQRPDTLRLALEEQRQTTRNAGNTGISEGAPKPLGGNSENISAQASAPAPLPPDSKTAETSPSAPSDTSTASAQPSNTATASAVPATTQVTATETSAAPTSAVAGQGVITPTPTTQAAPTPVGGSQTAVSDTAAGAPQKTEVQVIRQPTFPADSSKPSEPAAAPVSTSTKESAGGKPSDNSGTKAPVAEPNPLAVPTSQPPSTSTPQTQAPAGTNLAAVQGDKGKFAIQVASLTHPRREQGAKELQTLIQKEFGLKVEVLSQDNGKTLKVRIPGFPDRATATQVLEKIKAHPKLKTAYIVTP
jgi:hypothetical protein